jgi:hypothetical protein
MMTPDQAWDWHVFKSQGGPTDAGSAGWKRFTDFLISKMRGFGAVDLDYVEIPYDHYIGALRALVGGQLAKLA